MKKIILSFSNNIFIIFFFSLAVSFLFPERIIAQTDATIYFDSTKQIIRGFGAANIVGWRPDMTADQVTKAFGTGNGQLGFTILRVRIPYNSNEFNINVTTAQLAYNLGAKIIASPWSPPAWMKTNNNIVGGRLRDTSYASYALHLKSFADYMQGNGIPLYAISIQNEPDVSVTYESCDWNATEMHRFVKENASSIGTDIIVPESFNFNHTISDTILNDPLAAENVSIIGGHIYGGGLTSYPLAESKGKELWMTEHLDTDTTWSHVLATGKEINDCLSAGMNAYIWWYIVRFYGPIHENGNITKRGYVMSQYSRFIRPDYVRISSTSNPQAGVYLSTYKSGSKIIIVVINDNASSVSQTFSIQNGPAGTYTPYITSQTKNCSQGNDIVLSNNSFTAMLDGSSITTFVSDGIANVPVELVSFSADASVDKVTLNWQTATELNNHGFEIQRSLDENNFITIGFINGCGTTTESHSYSYVDKNINGKFYYRLKQFDFNGMFKYSDIVEATTLPDKFILYQNYPNPFNPVTQIKYSIPESGYLSLKIFNLLGEEVATLFEGVQQAGSYITSFDGSGLAGGVYLYRMEANSFVQARKFILLK